MCQLIQYTTNFIGENQTVKTYLLKKRLIVKLSDASRIRRTGFYSLPKGSKPVLMITHDYSIYNNLLCLISNFQNHHFSFLLT